MVTSVVSFAQTTPKTTAATTRVPATHLIRNAHPASGARILNSCGVTAAFTPGNDSVEHTSQQLGPFTNASINATTITWLLNGVPAGSTQTINWGFQVPGLYEVGIVAQNGACTDTATCFYYITGQQPPNRDNIKALYGTVNDQHSVDITAAPSGGYLLAGYAYSNSYGAYPRTLLVRTNESGCIAWSKVVPSAIGGQPYKVLALPNGDFACSGYSDNINYFMLLDPAGNILWSKVYQLGGNRFIPQFIAASPNGGFVLAGSIGYDGIAVIRTDAAGNVLWTHFWALPTPQQTSYDLTALLALGPNIYLAGMVFPNFTSSSGYTLGQTFMIVANDADGSTAASNAYRLDGNYFTPLDIKPYAGWLVMSSAGGSTVTNAANTLHFLNVAGDPLHSLTLTIPGAQHAPIWLGSVIEPLPTGEMYLLNAGNENYGPPLPPATAHHSVFLKLDAFQNVIWGRDYSNSPQGQFYFATLGQNNVLAALGDEMGNGTVPWNQFSYKLMFKKMDDADPDGTFNNVCDFYTPTVGSTLETLVSQPFSWTSETAPAATVVDAGLSLTDPYAQVRYECPEFVDSCSFLTLTGTGSVCDLSGGYTYRVHRNSACGEPIQWDLPANVTMLGQTDTTVTLQFPSFGTYKIGSSLPFACSPIKDSMFVIAASRSHPLALGNDTTICDNTSFMLHAGTGFLRYSWQDGSADSVYTVTMPGTYTVQVADSCDNILTATVVVKPYPDTVVDAGPARVKCNADTIQIAAPAGYLSYSWSPDYNLSSLTARQVVVDPALDTVYVLKAGTIPGCFAYDSVRIKVNHSPPIALGPDRNLCAGDSLLMDAGPGFSQYQWSTGAVTEEIAASNKGAYWVKATAGDGCTSVDTLQILNVFTLPPVDLDHNSGLCTGETRTLTAAKGYTYLWSTGSTAGSISITDTGTYSVTVTDGHGCVNSDSVMVTTFLPVPAGYLPGDTAICSYGKLELIPTAIFQSYLWSTGATDKSITISKPGVYWLEATDNNGCVGTDTIVVSQKDCMEGFYIPNAFTPGGASNTLFRPLLFGNILQYEFGIYDRWGQLVFQSNQPGAGWNGNDHGTPVAPGVFAWYCRYTLDGQPPQVQKGTVILIR